MARLSIRLLGPYDVTLDGESVTSLSTDKVRVLLAYLAMSPDQTLRRETLAGLLWPEYGESSARASLRNALAILRRAIGDREASPPFLQITRQSIRFNANSDYWVDAAEFAAIAMASAASTGALERASSLYRGPFLQGFSSSDSPALEEWLLLTREQFNRQTGEVLRELVQRHQARGTYHQALPHAWRYVELDPWREEAQRLLIRLLALDGQRSAALAQYEVCCKTLADELGVEPEPETTRLYEQVRDGKLKPLAARPDLAATPDLTQQLDLALEPEQAPTPPSFLADDPVRPYPPVFVAREQELDWLASKLDDALAGNGQVVFVTGGPGRGKTALLAEFARRAMEANAGLLVASGACNAYSGVGDPHLPFREVLAMLTGDVEASWAAGTISRDHALRLWSILPAASQALVDHGPHVAPALIPCLALLARAQAAAPGGATWLHELVDRIDCSQSASEALEEAGLYQQVTNLLRGLAASQPLLLVLDDLQWVDAASAGLLFHLGRRLAGSRILLAGAYRPEEITRRHTGAGGAGALPHPLAKILAELQREFGDLRLDLARVPESEGRHFVDSLLDSEANALGINFRSALFDHTAGHPLFTVELLRAMQERGDLRRDEAGAWIEGDALDWTRLPPRVEGIIQARIGRLDRELVDLLRAASVEGEVFTSQIMARLQRLDDRQALQLLSRDLEDRHHLVREQSLATVGPHMLARYRFSHALFQQYLYRSLGEAERVLLHGEIASILEDLYQDRLEEIAAILAHHAAQARDHHRALTYSTLAGDVALRAYANEEAKGYYRQALDLQPSEAQAADLYANLGEALGRQNRFQEAGAAWREAIQRYRRQGELDSVAWFYARSAWSARQAGAPDEQLRICLEGLSQVGEAADGPGLARLLHETARAYADHAMIAEAAPCARRALEMAERLDDEEERAHTLAALSAPVTGVLEERAAIAARAVELAEASGLLLAAQHAHRDLAALRANLADYPAAREHCLRGADLARQAGSTAAQSRILAFLVHLADSFGDIEGAGRALSQARLLLDDLPGPSRAETRVRLEELWHLVHLGDWTACIQKAHTLLASLRDTGAERDLADALLCAGWAILESRALQTTSDAGEWLVAEEALIEAAEIYARSASPQWGTRAQVLLGYLYHRQDRSADARKMLAAARQGDQQWPLFWLVGPRQWLEGCLSLAAGHWAEAIDRFEDSSQTHDGSRARWWWARLRLDWAEAHLSRGQAGDRERAADLLRVAQEAFHDMGVPRYAAIARERLRNLGAKQDNAGW